MAIIRRTVVAPAAVALAALTALAGCAASSSTQTLRPATSPSPGTPSSSAPATGSSQSSADAARDGIIPALAALPLAVRMRVIAAQVTPEGVWVLSRPTEAAKSYAKGCRLGPETGKYPTDTICTTEYGEVLLLDSTRTHILRAYPLAAVPPTLLRVTPTAIYFGRTGDTQLSETTLPDSMVGRIDRATLTAVVHVFAPGEESEVLQPCYFPPKYWVVTQGRITVSDLQLDARGLWVKGGARWTRLDPVTLKVLARDVTR
jgi:hypothetical protein